MDHAGHRERLRKRYLQEGLSSFAPHETLELLLTYAIQRKDTNPLAHALIRRFGSLSAVLEAAPAELMRVEGIGPQAATLLSMAVPLMRAYEQEKLLPKRRIGTYSSLRAYCRTLYFGTQNEQFYVLALDARLSLLSVKLLAQGTPSQVRVEPRQVAEELLRVGATGAVITHNHPSGNAFPSQEDIDLTLSIQELLNGMDIRLYDHVLVADNQYYSFFANHWLDGNGINAPEDESAPLAADRPLKAIPAKRKKK